MSRTISTNTTGPVVLGTADNPLSITSTGTVASAGSGVDGIDGGAGTTWTITNAGKVSSSGGNGVSLAGRGVINNTGSASGKDALVLRAGGSVTNNVGGSISGFGALGAGLGVGAGVYITGATGTVTNHASISGVAYGVGLGHGGLVTNTGSISGGEDGVIIQGAIGTISNSHTIIATVDDGVALFAGGGVTNVSGASIVDHGRGASVYITGATGTVTNAGSISAVFDGVFIADGGSLSNAASGSITAQNIGVFFKNRAGTLINAGRISGTGTQGTGIYLGANGSITNTSTGTITGHIFGAFIEGGFGTIVNSGSISGVTDDGVVLGLGGTVTNAAGASISGASGGIYVKSRAAGTVTNSGLVSASGTSGAGIDLADGGTLTNNSTGSVNGGGFGVFVTGAAGTVTNRGHIAGTRNAGVVLVKGGSVTNSTGATIAGGSNGVYAESGGSGIVTNSGHITATGTNSTGVALGHGGSVTNNSGGSISGSSFGVFTTGALGTVTNSGSISGSHGVELGAGGSVTNNASDSISGRVAGVAVQGSVGTLVNAGHISATSGAAADFEKGGRITNEAGATLSGSSFGVFFTGGSGTVTNAGTISGATDAIDFLASGANRLVVDPGAVFVGKVTAAGSTNTLELASGTGSISGVGTASFSNFQTLTVDAGANWTLGGTNNTPNVLDNGVVNVAGTFDISSAINPSSTGLFQLQTGATLEVAAASGTRTRVNFSGSSELIVDHAASFGTNVGTSSYAGTQLQHFVSGDRIDLKSFSSAGVTLAYNSSTGVLQVSNGARQVASLDFQTSSLGSGTFNATGDGGTGILITRAPSVAAAAVSSITTPSTAITDPSAMTTSPSSAPPALGLTNTSSETPIIRLAALFDQFVAAGFHGDQGGAGQIASTPQAQSGLEDLAFLSKPHHSG